LRLHRSILLLMIAAMLPLLILSASLGWFFLREQSVSIEEEALSRVRQLATIISRDLTAQADLLLVMGEAREFDGELDRSLVLDFLQRVQRQQPHWRALRLTTPSEQTLADFPVEVADGRIVDAVSHRRTVERRQPAVGRMLRGPRGDPAFALRAPVLRNGELRYILSAVVTPVAISKLLQDVQFSSEWIGTVIDGEGYVVARTAGPSSMIAEQASPAALQARQNGPEGIYEGLTFEGIPTISVFREVGVAEWSVHIGVPAAVFHAPQRHVVLLVTGASTGTVILAGIFVWLLLRELAAQRKNSMQLERVRRLEGLGRMTGGVAHDFNNLLMIVQGSAEGIKRRPADRQRLDTGISAILTAAQCGRALTSQLLAFARRGPNLPSVVRLQDCAAELERMLQRTVTDTVQVLVKIPAETWNVKADKNSLDVALINLVVNARDAMPRGGCVHVSARNVVFTKVDDGPEGLTGHFVAIAVVDTGMGIDPKDILNIFDPFFTTKLAGMGTGLGLSQVHGFAVQSGGIATVQSRLGEGSTFTIYLPRSEAVPHRETLEVTIVHNKGRILLVEDDAGVANVTVNMLNDAGFDVTLAAEASRALDLVKEGQYDVVLTDIVLGNGPSGLDLVRQLRRCGFAGRIVLVTGYTANIEEARALNLPLLFKPFSQREIMGALRAS
jgi:signal transduction histidine kinase